MPILIDLFDQYASLNMFDLGAYTIVGAALASRFIYYLSQVFSPLISRSYINLTPAHKADWDTRTVSTIHAILVAYFAYHIIFFDPDTARKCYLDPVNFRSRLGLFTQCIIGGYLANDTWIVWQHRDGISAVTSTLIHHIIALAGVFFVWFLEVSHFYPLCYALSEASTPFVNFRWWLYTAELKHTKLYLIAGLLMTISFFAIRILLVPFLVLHSYYRITLPGILALPWDQLVITTFFPTAGNLLNAFWFVHIARGLIRTFFSPARRQQHQHHQHQVKKQK